jgi:hypothetical protein
MTARLQYNDAAGYWHLGFRTPGVPYFPGGPALSVEELGSKGTSQRIMAQGVSGSAWSSYYLGQVLDFLGTSPGDILHRGDTGWERLPASSNSMHVLRSRGTASPISWGLQLVPSRVYATTGTSVLSASVIPPDNTIPQIGEGRPLLSVSITPVKESSIIRVTAKGYGIPSGGAAFYTIALFKNAGADAIRAGLVGGTTWLYNEVMHEAPASVLTSISYSVNVGPDNNNVVINGALFGGTASFSLSAEEIFTE